MYFNLITLAPGRERQAAHEWAGGPYAEHQWLWRFFPAPEGSPRTFLFRRADTDQGPRFYVLSEQPAQPPGSAWQIQTRGYRPMLAAGDKLRFELRANPVVTITENGKSRRHDVVMQEKKRLLAAKGLSKWKDWEDGTRPPLYELVYQTCGEWLNKRARKLGFSLDMESLSVEGYQPQRGKGELLRFTTVDFSGILSVTDPDAFQKALFQGIGPAKAFGCGLLLIRPV